MIDLQVIIGVVNWTGYLRLSAAKYVTPSTEVYADYIPVPFTNHTHIIPDLEPVIYLVSFREAPDVLSMGTLRSQAYVNALTGEWEYERRFYKVGDLPEGVTLDGTGKILNDPYLLGKNVTGVFKEGFRYLKPATEYEFDTDAGEVELVNDAIFDLNEMIIVEIKYNTGSSTTTVTTSALFKDTISVTASTYTISAADKAKRFCLDCSGATQVITLPLLSTLVIGDFVYLEHKRNGAQKQSKIVCQLDDLVNFFGFDQGWFNELQELWLSRGESLYLRKDNVDGTDFWEIIFDYKGTEVGKRMSATFKDHPNWLPEDGRLLDGDEYPALWWWLKNIVPNTHYVEDDNVVNGGYTHPVAKPGLFVLHTTLKKFRLPNTQELSEKGLKDFDSYGTDAQRSYDYPGGKQDDQNKAHDHGLPIDQSGPLNLRTVSDTSGSDESISEAHRTGSSGGAEVRVKNYGVIYMRRI